MAVLEVRGLSKRYPGVLALSGVALTLGRGEVLGVVGENGAGKSTLMKILAGIERADGGEILVDGQRAAIGSVADARRLGIALIHQELPLADNLDIAANIFLGREPRRLGPLGLIDRARLDRDARAVMARVGLDEPPGTLVERLPIGRRQLVEIAKALAVEARILIMDEPTSSLSQGEVDPLFRVVGDLRARGLSVLYVSHRLGEVKALCDRAVVLRDGRLAGELQRAEIDHDALVKRMVGRDLGVRAAGEARALGAPVLEAHAIRTPSHPRHAVSFTVHAGEIVGVAGLLGAGRTSLLKTLFGITRPLSGALRVAGRAFTPRAPLDAIRAGVALVPEDRKHQGLILEMAVRQNLSLPSLGGGRRAGLLDERRERELSREMIRRLDVKVSSDEQAAQHLSGGNQQKVVLGKWLATSPRVLLLDEPTRCLDVGAKAEIYRLLDRFARDGGAVLFVSSELEEVIRLSDRALVMHEGRVAGELQRDALSEEAIMRLATGRAAA